MAISSQQGQKMAYFSAPSGPKDLTDILIPELLTGRVEIQGFLESVPSMKTVDKHVVYGTSTERARQLGNSVITQEGFLLPGEFPSSVSICAADYASFKEMYESLTKRGYHFPSVYDHILNVFSTVNNPWERVIEASIHQVNIKEVTSTKKRSLESEYLSFPFEEYVEGLKSRGLKLIRRE